MGQGLLQSASPSLSRAQQFHLPPPLTPTDTCACSTLCLLRRLFATLDPTLRRVALPSGRDAILSDTVGFISDLPVQLIDAFQVHGGRVQVWGQGIAGWREACDRGHAISRGMVLLVLVFRRSVSTFVFGVTNSTAMSGNIVGEFMFE